MTTPDSARVPRAPALMGIYSALVYAAFLVVFVYTVGFVENVAVPTGIDDASDGAWGTAVVVDLVVLTVFALQHSVMARPAFKRRWTRFVTAPIERSTYVLFATAALVLVVWLWRPIDSIVWEVDGSTGRGALYAVSFAGWAIVLLSTFLIDHLDLFGLRQVLQHLRGQGPTDPDFRTPLLYRIVRHPLYLGFVIAFWAAPTMTVGHVLFAAATTAYILVGVQLEERDLVTVFGRQYRDYRQRVPMLVPWRRARSQ